MSLLKLSKTDEDCENVFNGWEKLDTDILARIFKNNFSLNELTSGVAHVSSRWRMACCDPTLWYTLDLSHMKSNFILTRVHPFVYVDRRSDQDLTRILKLSMSLSKGNTRTLIFHYNLFVTNDMITYTTHRCPNLRRLVLPAWNRINEKGTCKAIRFCKNLESLTMPSMLDPDHVFSSIRNNCKNFRELKVMGPIELYFVYSLAKYLPKLKVLSIRCNAIYENALIKILDKMESLEVLNTSHSYILEKKLGWSKIMEKTTKLKRFVTCMEAETCVMCRRTKEDEGMIRWYKCEEGQWKADEISSLHL